MTPKGFAVHLPCRGYNRIGYSAPFFGSCGPVGTISQGWIAAHLQNNLESVLWDSCPRRLQELLPTAAPIPRTSKGHTSGWVLGWSHAVPPLGYGWFLASTSNMAFKGPCISTLLGLGPDMASYLEAEGTCSQAITAAPIITWPTLLKGYTSGL